MALKKGRPADQCHQNKKVQDFVSVVVLNRMHCVLFRNTHGKNSWHCFFSFLWPTKRDFFGIQRVAGPGANAKQNHVLAAVQLRCKNRHLADKVVVTKQVKQTFLWWYSIECASFFSKTHCKTVLIMFFDHVVNREQVTFWHLLVVCCYWLSWKDSKMAQKLWPGRPSSCHDKSVVIFLNGVNRQNTLHSLH